MTSNIKKIESDKILITDNLIFVRTYIMDEHIILSMLKFISFSIDAHV